jgi:hypothetical protein
MTRWDWEFLAEKNMNENQMRLLRAQAMAIEAIQKELEKAREALSFYAAGASSRDWNELGLEDNYGHKAREALK